MRFRGGGGGGGGGTGLPELTAGDAGKGVLWDGAEWVTPDMATQAELSAAVAAGVSPVASSTGKGRAGVLAEPVSGGNGTVGIIAQSLHAVKWVPSADKLIATLKCEVTSLAAGADMDMAILDAEGNRVKSSGAQVDIGATTGVKSFTLTGGQAVVAGTIYYIAVLSDASPTLRGVNCGSPNSLIRFGSTIGTVDYYSDSAHGTSIQAASAADNPGGNGTYPLLSAHE